MKNIDNNIKKLFNKLIYETPEAISINNCLDYTINGKRIKVYWVVKSKSHLEGTSCALNSVEPFDRDRVRRDNRFFPYAQWEVDTSELDGYTFFIETPICTFRVPELSRAELCEVCARIEEIYENFVPDYLDSLIV